MVRLGGSSDGDTGQIRMLYRAGPNDDFRTVVRERTNLYDDIKVPAHLLKGGKAYAYRRKDGYRTPYEYDLAAMKLGKRVFGIDGHDIDTAIEPRDGDQLSGVAVTTGRSRVEWMDPRLKEIQASLEESAGKGNVAIASTDAARKKVLFRMGRMGQAAGRYLFDTKPVPSA